MTSGERINLEEEEEEEEEKKKKKKSVIGGSCHQYDFCRDKMFLATNIFLSQQNVCHDKTRLVSRRKHTFVVTKDVFVATKLLLRQTSYLLQLLPMIEKVNGSGRSKLVQDRNSWQYTKHAPTLL